MQVFSRIKEERERLGLSQEDFAKAGGVSRRAHIYYEQGERSPSADYLAGIAKAGADVGYILTGIKQQAFGGEGELKPDEQVLLEQYRHLGESQRQTLSEVGRALSISVDADNKKAGAG